MLEFVSKYKEKIAIVVNCVDRLQRSYKDTPILDEMRKEGKIEVHFLKEKLILMILRITMELTPCPTWKPSLWQPTLF